MTKKRLGNKFQDGKRSTQSGFFRERGRGKNIVQAGLKVVS
jgi:hypothetical protein